MKTISTKQLKNILETMPDNAKVYLSRDSEGNGYSTLDNTSVGYSQEDNVIVIYPHSEGLEYEDIMPISYKEME